MYSRVCYKWVEQGYTWYLLGGRMEEEQRNKKANTNPNATHTKPSSNQVIPRSKPNSLHPFHFDSKENERAKENSRHLFVSWMERDQELRNWWDTQE